MRKFPPIIFFLILSASFYDVAGQTPLKMRDTTIQGPQTFAIIIGISKYKYVQPLTYADKDAELVRDFLKSPGGGNVKDDNIFCLLNEKASSSNFWSKGFQWLGAKKLQKGDRLFIYLAGHGDAIDEDQFFFLGYDCNPGGDKNNYLVGGAIQLFNLKKKIAAETSIGVEVFFIMDACRTSELPGGIPGQNFLNSAVSEKKVGEIIMLATGAGQQSLEDASIGSGHGLFTYYLVDGLSGAADSMGTADKKISFREIESYIDKNVPSVALQRFKRQQNPFFCCNEFDDTIISVVDTAYLQKWLKTKKLQNRGPGNSFPGNSSQPIRTMAVDTSLIKTYDLFYRAIKDNHLTGRSSAEYYYQQLDKKFPGSPYTLDAKSTLAVEYIDYAQRKVNQYLDCGDTRSSKEKQDNYEAGMRLEKAIRMMKDDEPDFTASLAGRMYFLKASGANDNNTAFQNAYAALAINPNGAYINNRLATLHLENNRPDSAVYYAKLATEAAPKWVCAFTTLSLAQKTLSSNKPPDKVKKPGKITGGKIHFGIVTGGGISKVAVTKKSFGTSDTLKATGVRGGTKFDLGIIAQISLGNSISIKPSVLVSFDQSNITFERTRAVGGTVIETVSVKTTSLDIPVPLVFRLPGKNIVPFISAGPTFSFLAQKKDINSSRLPVKSFDVLGDLGFGVDIIPPKSGIIISPELSYSRGFLDTHTNSKSGYSNVITKLNRQAFMFSMYLRKK